MFQKLGLVVYTWKAFSQLWSVGAHADIDYDFGLRRPVAEDVCTLMYTSGTTGEGGSLSDGWGGGGGCLYAVP